MPRIALRTIHPEDLSHLVPPEVLGRGRRYFREGAVLSLDSGDGSLRACVAGSRRQPYQVKIQEKGGGSLAIACTCPFAYDYGTCKHAVATLLAWMAQRDEQAAAALVPAVRPAASPARPSAPARCAPLPPGRGWHPSPSVEDDFLDGDHDSGEEEGVDAEDEGWDEDEPSPLRDALDAALAGAAGLGMPWGGLGEPEQIEVDLHGEGPGLEMHLTLPDGWKVTVVAPPRRTPDLIEELRHDHTIRWTPRALNLRVNTAPLAPELQADYDAEGNLVLTPMYRVKGSVIKGEAYPAEAVRQALTEAGDNWFWDGKGFHPVAPPPKALLPYFSGEKPLRLEGDAIPVFLQQEYPRLASEDGFWPSKRLRNAQVLRDTQLTAVAVEAGEGDWLWLDPVYQVGDHRLTLQEIAKLQGKGRYARLGDNWVAIKESTPLLFWRQAGGKLEDGRVRLPKLGYLRARAEWGAGVAVQATENVRQFEADLDRIRPPRPAPECPGYVGELRPYQRTGYDWLWFLRESGLHGILADEMGLGKTHQAIVLLAAAHADGAAGPSLVVCPTSVLDHWEAKIHAHGPSLKPRHHHGTGRAPLEPANLPPVVLTTYSLLGRDLEQLKAIQWEYVILDEAQKIKNPGTQMAQAARALRARHRLALTGTPIENRPSELWAIFDFLMPGYLGSAERFRERYDVPILRHGDAVAGTTLRRVVHPFKLRRLKREVLAELPPKVEDVRFCHLSPHQAALYREAVAQQGRPLVDNLRRPTTKVDYLHIFAVLSRLKRICDHPALVLEGARGRHLSSGKFDLFKELMEEALDGDAKVVVFSQYLEMLDLIEDWLRAKGVGFSGLRGSTQKRGKAVQTFQEDPACRVFVGSLMAGGLGIDLTAASIVIHYDRWWNAAREDQATDRVHRIGQSRGVQVLKLVTRGTLEEKIDAMIRAKAALMNTIVEKDDAVLKSLTRDELIDLLTATP